MEKIRILISDDVPILAEQIKNSVIKNENVEVVGIAKNGKEEYEKILELKPDISITDNQMPEMTGIEVIRKVKDQELDIHPKFILITGDYDLKIMQEQKELSIIGILHKPYRENDLLELLKNSNEKEEEQIECIIAKKENFFQRLLSRLFVGK